jgi:hypothetical protein
VRGVEHRRDRLVVNDHDIARSDEFVEAAYPVRRTPVSVRLRRSLARRARAACAVGSRFAIRRRAPGDLHGVAVGHQLTQARL